MIIVKIRKGCQSKNLNGNRQWIKEYNTKANGSNGSVVGKLGGGRPNLPKWGGVTANGGPRQEVSVSRKTWHRRPTSPQGPHPSAFGIFPLPKRAREEPADYRSALYEYK